MVSPEVKTLNYRPPPPPTMWPWFNSAVNSAVKKRVKEWVLNKPIKRSQSTLGSCISDTSLYSFYLFSSLLWEIYAQVFPFSSLTKNQTKVWGETEADEENFRVGFQPKLSPPNTPGGGGVAVVGHAQEAKVDTTAWLCKVHSRCILRLSQIQL